MAEQNRSERQLLLSRTAERTLALSHTFSDEPGGIRWRRWDWSIGVAFYGVVKAGEAAGDAPYDLMLKGWIDGRIKAHFEKVCVNSNSLLLTMLHLRDQDDEGQYASFFQTFDDYLLNSGPRTDSGALEHTVLDNDWSDQVWADTLFMSLLYMAQRGAILHDERFRLEAGRQLALHCKLLFDPEEKLFYHGWNDKQRKWIGVHWGRGNAWMTAGIVDILELLPSEFAEREAILETLHAQVKRLAELQEASGLWRTVLNRKDTYTETSATAGIAYGLLKGIRLGLISEQYREVAERALDAVVASIDEEGYVTGGSSGTPVKADAEAYNQIPYEITPFTQGLALLALHEGLQPNNKGSVSIHEAV
ncbi:glycoside hydrolase family 88 protein [Paenibacillus algorifonticola]|uniref:glycoside hydrolase family 88/105 protein n=1 Tax=Paenibacillus algorifonticola TaxID=684063 RepID=UPI003D2B5C99